MTYYLKYRPQKISELDLTSVRETLVQILAAKSLPHAWLFTGPKGTGKTSSARIVAKSVNCAAKTNPPEPCNRCAACRSISAQTALDVIEIDAASNRGIDDIRELKDKIRLAPSSLKYKVYIIDEVHMLTAEAFNALLKTLEEPPGHALFILCTTEPEKLPATVVSRCLVVNFYRATVPELARSLRRVVKGESLAIDAADLGKIASASDGSFRDAVKILDTLAVSGKKISAKAVEALVSSGLTAAALDRWLILVYNRQSKEALAWLQQAWTLGSRPKNLLTMALLRLRQVLLLRLGVGEAGDIEAIDNLDQLKELTGLFLKAAEATKTAAIESLPLELAVASWGQSGAVPPAGKTQEVKPQLRPKADRSLAENWERILEAVRPLNHSLEALLKATEPLGFEKDWLLVRVFYKFHKERLEEERYRRMVETAAARILAAPVKIRLVLEEKARQADNLKPVAEADIIKTAEEIFGAGGD